MSISRRGFVLGTVAAGLASAVGKARGAEAGQKRKFAMCLSCGPIGVSDDPRKAIERASQFGYEAIEPSPGFLAKLSDMELLAYVEEMAKKKLQWGAAGLSVNFRGDDASFSQGMKALPGVAAALQRAGATRVATWLSPGHRTLTYVANFRQHATRLREAAKVLRDHGVRLGLEYVGPKTSWTASRFPFIHTMAEMKDLIAEMNVPTVGFLLDSWHWYTAQETEADLLSLKNSDVVLCHLNDAPKDLTPDKQIDSRRELPCATGVIDTARFLGAMVKIGYDGPVVCEPFTQALRGMNAEQALGTVAAAMKKAFALVD